MQNKLIVINLMMLLLCSKAFSQDFGNLAIHGFASTGYMISDKYNFLANTEEGTFEFNEAGINFSSLLTDDIRIGMQLYSFDLGDIGNNRINLDWAFLDYSWKDELGIRLGKVKTPFGLYTEILDYDLLYTFALLPQSIYFRYLRDSIVSIQGFSLYGKIHIGNAGIIAYDIYNGTRNIESDGGLAKTLSINNNIFKSGRTKKSIGSRIKYTTPLRGLTLAGSFLFTDFIYDIQQSQSSMIGITSASNTGASMPLNVEVSYPDVTMTIFSAEYNNGNLSASAEYQTTKSTEKIKMKTSAYGINDILIENDVDTIAYYGMLSYRFSKFFESGAYYSVYESEQNNSVNMPGTHKDLAICTRFDINDFWLIKLEIHFMDGIMQVLDINKNRGNKWTLFACKTTFNF